MKKLYYDVKKCLACRSCEIACALSHANSAKLSQALKEETVSLPRKKISAANRKNYPVSCRHCKEPSCVDACMAAALRVDPATGMVIHDRERCVGCWMCVMVCPYGAIRPDLKSRVPLRCDKCRDKEEPACLKSCPTGAIIYQEEA